MRVVFLRRRPLLKLTIVAAFSLLCFFSVYRFISPANGKKGNALLSIDNPWPVLKNEENVVPHPPLRKEGEDGNEQQGAGEGPLQQRGESAVFKKGILGNYEPKEPPKSFKPGEEGKPVHTSLEEKPKADQTVREFGFNMVASDKMAWNRSIPDTRMDECKYWHYPSNLPTASVILVFYNEGWSTLLRTVHSIINTSPPQLLHEVVLIDDESDKDILKEPLEEYIKQWNGKVKLYRNKERLGLIQARNRGAELSTGDVIVFLDAHCECNRNWLPPLLSRINYDRTILAVPIVDGINWDNMAYYSVYDSRHHRGIFEWGFLYKESIVPEKELATRSHASEPYKSPTHAGGLFAMDRKYFWEMGGYDPGLQIWGGENYELAFKVWMCGGSSEWVPCSRVGHIYRGPRVAGLGKVKSDPKLPFSLVNYMRVVEVWMDEEHKEFFYTREPMGRGAPIGDISKQLQFKKDHNCKSFKWFMENVAYEVYDKFPKLPPNKAWGEVKEKEGQQRCWDTLGQSAGGGAIGVYYCHSGGGNQLFRINTKGQIGLGERCIEAQNGDTLHIRYCEVQPVGPWDYNESLNQIKHTVHQKCIESGQDGKLHLATCDPGSANQKWIVNEIYPWKS
ncbi:N-acetylgalactosaminyltransferase 7-like isoform X2 [Pomacea canaliculata]|uniref:N-acetylgalactosaminyltransferase 7-like isoform X2 n=1 Tax=Pomacea canaliculata TaxID=400727 RepID=UPI000D7308C4|nr:N-acetylgalactosaminyltransferase 7-like isoform X2 [Pomacea canaliculata]